METPTPGFLHLNKFASKILGVNRYNGEQTGWGKALNLIPGLNLATGIDRSILAHGAGGADEFKSNIKHSAGAAYLGAGAEALSGAEIGLGAFTGNPALIGTGVKTLSGAISGDIKNGRPNISNPFSTKDMHPFIQSLFNKPKQQYDAPTGADENPTAPEVGGQEIQTNGGGMDWSNFGLGDLQMRKGGKVKGKSHEEGGVPLLKNGKHMGITVEGGEVVTNEDDWDELKTLAKSGRSKAALALLMNIEKRTPQKGEMAEGGKVVDQIYPYAKQLQDKYGIPIEVTLAIAKEENVNPKHNNPFGISKNEKPVTYDSLEQGVQAFADTLKQGRYKEAFKYKDKPDKFVDEIVKAGYNSVNPNYAADVKKKLGAAADVKKSTPQYLEGVTDSKGKPIETNFDYKGFKTSKQIMDRYKQLGELTDGGIKATGDDLASTQNYTKAKQALEQERDNLKNNVIPKVEGAGYGYSGLTNQNVIVPPHIFDESGNTAAKNQQPVTGPEVEISPKPQFKTGPDPTGDPLITEQNTSVAKNNPPNAISDTTPQQEPYVDISQQPVNSGTSNNSGKLNLTDDLGYSFDAARLGIGLLGATKKLPQYQIPQEWEDYVAKARYFSNTGLPAEDKAQYQDAAQRDYATDVNNIANYSQGNPGAVLGNLNGVNLGRYRTALALAGQDANMKRSNFAAFAPVLQTDVQMRKNIFDTKYNEVVANKQSGAQLASDAISDIQNRFQTNKEFGPNTRYAKLLDAETQQAQATKDAESAKAKLWSDPDYAKKFMGAWNFLPNNTQ